VGLVGGGEVRGSLEAAGEDLVVVRLDDARRTVTTLPASAVAEVVVDASAAG
jgi:hypothetical protein